jgi:hypothetical protein
MRTRRNDMWNAIRLLGLKAYVWFSYIDIPGNGTYEGEYND